MKTCTVHSKQVTCSRANPQAELALFKCTANSNELLQYTRWRQGFPTDKVSPHLANSIFCSATDQCETASCLTLVEPHCFRSSHGDFSLRKVQVARALRPKLQAFLRTTAFDYKFWRRDYTSAYCNSFSCYSKIQSVLDSWNKGKPYKTKLLKSGK